MPNRPRVLLTIPDVAERLCVSERTVYRLANAGHVDAVHVGRLIRITEDSVDSYIESLLHSPFTH